MKKFHTSFFFDRLRISSLRGNIKYKTGSLMESAFSKKRLGQLRQLLHEHATLDLQEDELYEAATSIVRYTAGRLLRDASKESEV